MALDSGPWLGDPVHQLLQTDHWLISKDAGSPRVLGGSQASVGICCTAPSSMPTSRSAYPQPLMLPLPWSPGYDYWHFSLQGQEETGEPLRMFSKSIVLITERAACLRQPENFCRLGILRDINSIHELHPYGPRSWSSCPAPSVTEPSTRVSPTGLCFLFSFYIFRCPTKSTLFSSFWNVYFLVQKPIILTLASKCSPLCLMSRYTTLVEGVWAWQSGGLTSPPQRKTWGRWSRQAKECERNKLAVSSLNAKLCSLCQHDSGQHAHAVPQGLRLSYLTLSATSLAPAPTTMIFVSLRKMFTQNTLSFWTLQINPRWYTYGFFLSLTQK